MHPRLALTNWVSSRLPDGLFASGMRRNSTLLEQGMIRNTLRLFLLAILMTTPPALAENLEVQVVTDGVWALVGPHEQRSASNLANNATFGAVATGDAGGSRRGAEEIHAAIGSLTDEPVKFVINTGGQDHRWLGNGYWKLQGAKIIASARAVDDQAERQSMQLSMLKQLLGDALSGTEPSQADIVFEDSYSFELGGMTFEIFHPGTAHTPGDSFVWLAAKDTVFAGDIVFVERLLGVLPQSNAKSWIAAFEAMAALNPAHVVPGHGHATNMQRAQFDTHDYLVNLREKIAQHIEDGGDMIGSVGVDQSAFAGLEQFDLLSKRNAQQVYSEMEWE